MDLPDPIPPYTAPALPLDDNEDDVNEDALFDAPPEPDDTAEFHDANQEVEAIAQPPTPTQGENIAPSPNRSSPPSLEERVAHFTDLFGDIKEELKDTKAYLHHAQEQASLHEAQLNHFAKKEAQQDADHRDVLTRLSQAQAELAMI